MASWKGLLKFELRAFNPSKKFCFKILLTSRTEKVLKTEGQELQGLLFSSAETAFKDKVKVKSVSHSVVSNSLRPHGL